VHNGVTPAYGVGDRPGVADVTQHGLGPVRRQWPVAALQGTYLVTAGREVPADLRAEESAAAGDEDLHAPSSVPT
jgi:hypothetical protein